MCSRKATQGSNPCLSAIFAYVKLRQKWQRIENRDSKVDKNRFSIRSNFDYRFSKIMSFLFEKLDVYRKSVDFADNICEITKDFPKGNYFLADQLNRASLSISANIAEGNGRYTKAGRINFFRISRIQRLSVSRYLRFVPVEGWSIQRRVNY